jgi:putative ABC transport system substrate-binding protein
MLSPTSAATAVRFYDPFRAVLRELGHVEGRNLRIEARYADGVPARLPALAAELVALRPDLIVATSTPGTLAAHGATQTIPIVMITLQDPVQIGVVKSISRPGGNVTGVWTFGGADALIGKRIGLLKEVVPALSRLGVMLAADDPSGEIVLKLLPAIARALDVTYQVSQLRTNAELEAAFAQSARDGLQGLFVDQSPFFLTRRAEVAELAARVRLPAIYGYREHAEAGGLMSYGSSLPDAYRQIARFTDKILKGAKPAELPVEQSDKFELVVNNKTAKALGLTIPESFLLRADEVIE